MLRLVRCSMYGSTNKFDIVALAETNPDSAGNLYRKFWDDQNHQIEQLDSPRNPMIHLDFY